MKKTTLTALTLSLFGAAHAETLTVSLFPDMDTAIKAAIALPEFKKEFPGVDVKIVPLAWADHHTALTNALATGSGAGDVVAIDVSYIAKFAETTGLQDLNKAPYSAGSLKSKFVPFTIAQATTDDGRLIALPNDIGPGSMFYRRSVLKKAGVSVADLTKSWDSFLEAGKKIKAKTGAYLIANANSVAELMYKSNIPAGEGVFFDKNGKVLVDSPRFVKAFQIAKAVHDAGLDGNINEWTNEWYEGFRKGTVATQFSGAWLYGQLKGWMAPDTGGDWGIANLPNNAYASWGGAFWAIPTQGKQKDLAWKFVKFITANKAAQLAAFKANGAFPSLKAAQSDPSFNEPIEFLGGQKARLMWKSAAARIKPIDVDKYDTVAQEIIYNTLKQVINENKDITAALAEAKTQIERRARR